MTGGAANATVEEGRPAEEGAAIPLYERGWFPVACHFGLALLLFHPMLLGWIIMGGTDSLFAHYPNLVFGHRSFATWDRFSVWNPYIFGGFDFTKSIHAHFLDPMWAPLLLIPKRYMFQAVTCFFFVSNGIIGFTWYRIARLRLADWWLAMLVGVVAQAGMFFWWTTTAFIATPMYLMTTLSIYLVLTFEQRSALRNYLWLSSLLFFIFVKSHPFYVLSFTVPVGAVYLVRTYPHYLWNAGRKITLTLLAAGTTAAVLAAYRLLPPLLSVAEEGATLHDVWLGTYTFRSYMLLTEFIPQAFGIYLAEASRITTLLEHLDYQTQVHNALYFGILPLVVCYIVARKAFDPSVRWLAWLFLLAVWVTEFMTAPLTDIMSVITFPVWHEVLLRISSNFLMLFLLISALRALPTISAAAIAASLREVMLLAALVLMSVATLWLRVLREAPTRTSIVPLERMFTGERLAFVVAIFGLFVAWRTTPRRVATLVGSWVVVGIGTIVALVSVVLQYQSGLLHGEEMTTRSILTVLCTIPFTIACMSLARRNVTLTWRDRNIMALSAVPLVVAIAVPLHGAPDDRGLLASGLSALLGCGLFVVLLAASARVLLSANGLDRLRLMAPIMLALTVGDLAGAFEVYSFVNTPSPFVRNFDHLFPAAPWAPREVQEQAQERSGDSRSRPNLLVNPDFAANNANLLGWGLGGGPDIRTCPAADTGTPVQSGSLGLCYAASDAAGNLYQDVALPTMSHVATFGVWLRAMAPARVRLMLVSPSANIGLFSDAAPSDGRWHWVAVSLNSKALMKDVRVHVNMAAKGAASVFAPKLITGWHLTPDQRPEGAEMPQPPRRPAEPIDLADFRVNDPLGPRGTNGFTNMAEVVRVPTYGGIDSDMPSDLAAFTTSLIASDPSWLMRGGIKSSVVDPRFLDLFGVGYDIGADGAIIRRANALARLSAFTSFRVEPDLPKAVAVLKDPTYDPTRQLVVDQKPANSSGDQPPTRFVPLHYVQTGADSLTVQISAETPRLILFNDHFSSSWMAHWNGQSLPIWHANGIFMAIAIPNGPGILRLSFEPILFDRLVRITEIGGSILLLAILIDLAVRGLPRRRRWIAAG